MGSQQVCKRVLAVMEGQSVLSLCLRWLIISWGIKLSKRPVSRLQTHGLYSLSCSLFQGKLVWVLNKYVNAILAVMEEQSKAKTMEGEETS